MTVSIVGVGLHPFGRADVSGRQMGLVVARAAADDAGISWNDVDFAAGGSRDSGHADALVSELGLTGVPFISVYNGCGTAGSAILTCTQAIEAGAAEVALAVGFDKHARGPFDSSAAEYGLPDWYAQDGMMVTTQFFALKIQRYMHDHGLDPRLLGEIAAKALRNGSITPHAWRRKPMSVDEIMAATMVNDPLTAYMFCSPSEGGAAVVLMSTERARQVSERSIEIKALEFRTRRFGTFEVFSPWLAPDITSGATVHAAQAAFEAAGVGPDEIDVAQVQDTEAGAELMHLAECGFCEHGDQARLILDGELEIGGRLPVNTDGGLIANGEPIGASGLRQVIECVLQLQGRAGERQVPGAPKTAFTQVYGAPGISACSVLAMSTTLVPLLERAEDDPDGDAIRSDVNGSATWAEVADATLRLAEAIRTSALGDDRRVLVIARNRPSTLVAHAAAALGSAASVPVNFHLTSGEISYIAAEAGARLAFVDSTTVEAARTALAGTDVVIVELPDHGIAGPGFDEFVAGHDPIELRDDQPVVPSLLFTSGTTGRPKAVQLPPKTVGGTATLAGFVEHSTSHRLAGLGAHLVVGPLYHNGPLTAVRLMLAGVPIVVHDRFDAEATLAAIERNRVESSVMVPTHFVRLLAVPDDVRDRYDMTSIRQVAHTGGKCPIDVKRAMIEWWGPVLSESYGGTESGTVCSINSTDWLAHPGSVGRAVEPFEAVVVDDDGGEVAPGVEGRLYFRDTTGRGIVYEGDPVKTAEAHIAPGVFTLGEIGYVDDDGFVYITDRFSDMVVSGGVNIYPAEAEQALQRHPAVSDVACIGVDDAEMGERLIGLVQLAGTGHDVDAVTAELSLWCRETLASYKCPKELIVVAEIPRNPMGKVDKKALKATYEGGRS